MLLTQDQLENYYLFDETNESIDFFHLMPPPLECSKPAYLGGCSMAILNLKNKIVDDLDRHDLKSFFENTKKAFEEPASRLIRDGLCWDGLEKSSTYSCKRSNISEKLQYVIYSWTRVTKEILAACSSQQKEEFLSKIENIALIADFVRNFTYFCALQLLPRPIQYLKPFYQAINEGFGNELILIDCSRAREGEQDYTCGRAVSQIEDKIYVFNTISRGDNSMNTNFIVEKLANRGGKRKERTRKDKYKHKQSKKKSTKSRKWQK